MFEPLYISYSKGFFVFLIDKVFDFYIFISDGIKPSGSRNVVKVFQTDNTHWDIAS